MPVEVKCGVWYLGGASTLYKFGALREQRTAHPRVHRGAGGAGLSRTQVSRLSLVA